MSQEAIKSTGMEVLRWMVKDGGGLLDSFLPWIIISGVILLVFGALFSVLCVIQCLRGK